MDRLTDFRDVFAQALLARAGCPGNERLRWAFQRVPRHDFLGPGPWVVREDGTTTLSSDAAIVYQDMGIGLAAGIPSGLPSLHAVFMNALGVVHGQRVMHVGAGTGYFTAILAELVGETGSVLGFEIEPALAARACVNLAPWSWARVEARSGIAIPEDPVDMIYVNAGVQQLPREWLAALAPGGQLLFPLVSSNGPGAAFIVTRGNAESFAARFLCRAQFVPCIGTQDPDASERLAQAFHGTGCELVRSLRLAPSTPDGTAWFAGDGWWLSTQDARAT